MKGRKKEKEWIMTSFKLEEKAKEQLDLLSGCWDMNRTEVLENLLMQTNISEEEKILKELRLIDNKIEELISERDEKRRKLRRLSEWREKNLEDKMRVMHHLKGLISNGNFQRAERFAKINQHVGNWIDLIDEARKYIEKEEFDEWQKRQQKK